MRQKLITFVRSFFIHGIILGLITYFGGSTSLKNTILQAVFFGLWMGLAYVFVIPKLNRKK